MAEDAGERNLPATPRRREEARKRGQVPQSRDLNSAVILLVGVAGIHYLGERMLGRGVEIILYCYQTPWLDMGVDRVRIEMSKLMVTALLAMGPWLLLLTLSAVAVNLGQQGGFVIAAEKSYFDLTRLNPLSGLKRIFSLRGLVKTGLDVGKVTIVGLAAYWFIQSEMLSLASLMTASFPTVAAYAFNRSLVLAYEMAAILLILALADYTYQRFQYERDLRMTNQEIKQETKDIEGDPKIRGRRRRIQMEMARRRMLEEIPEAEVVITNPTELAIAIKYKVQDMTTPVVVGKGAGLLAQRIRELAALHQIPIIENKPLAQLLYRKVELGGAIPEETFVAVAEILAYVYRITGKDAQLQSEGL